MGYHQAPSGRVSRLAERRNDWNFWVREKHFGEYAISREAS
jgi:hypothetical protein